MEDLLPIGSVVVTTDKRDLMIIGYLPDKPISGEFHEYICCNAKKGIKRDIEKIEFNKDYFYINIRDIDYVKFIGHQNKDFDLYLKCQKDYFEYLDRILKDGLDDKEDVIQKFFDELKEKYKKNEK
jgi:hypothetical protein